MSKTKVIIFWVFSLLALSAGIAGYFELRNTKKPQTDAIQALPDSCILYLSTANLHDLENKINQRNLITDQLRLLPQAAELFKALHVTDSLLSEEKELHDQLLDSRFHLAIYPRSEWLLCFTIRELGHETATRKALSEKLKAVIKEPYLQFSFLNQSLYCSLQKGLVRISPNLPLLKRSENQKRGLTSNPDFQQFLSTLTENKLLTVYSNQSLLTAQEGKPVLALNRIVHQGFFAAAAEASPSELRINGFQSVDSTEALYLLLQQEKSQTEDVFSNLPLNTAWFEAFGCQEFGDIPWEESKAAKDWWGTVNEQALFNVHKQFYESCSDLMVRFETQTKQLITCVLLRDTVQAQEALQLMSDSLLNKESLPFFRLSSAEGLRLFKPFVEDHFRFAMRIGTALYLSDNAATLSGLGSNLLSNYRLNANEDLLAYSQQNLPESFHYLVYTSPLQAVTIPGAFIHAAGTKGAYDNFRHLSFSLVGEKNYFKMRFHLMLQMGDSEQKVLWTARLDTTCSSKPFSFVNHNTNENEILIQDDANTLYLMNAKGQILWRKKMDEKIISDIQRVDIYKNGKFQLLFNTRTGLQLLDRNGKELPNFPLRLPGATAGLSLFDYDNTRDYRVVIPCADKTIYNFTLEGKKLEGFAPVKTEDIVDLPVQYVAVGPSQYLVAVDRSGHIYTFSRKGLPRIGLKNKTTAGCKSFYTDAGSNTLNTHLVFLDEQSGMLNKISFADVQHLSHLDMETADASLQFTQIDENRSVDLLIASVQQVAAYDFSGSLIFEKNTEDPVTSAVYLADESHTLVLLYSKEKGSLKVLDLLRHTEKTQKASAPGLPMDLFKDRHYYLLLPNSRELSCIPLK